VAAEEADLSRFEGDFTAVGDAQLSVAELLELIDSEGQKSREQRQAIARCLSGGEGWREAIQALRGSFSSDTAEAVRLSDGKADEDGVNQRV
jgi:hypothetical protein